MPDIDNLFNEVEWLPLTYRGLDIKIAFDPNQITGQHLADWSKQIEDAGNLTDDVFFPLQADRLSRFLVDWDFTRNGEKVPITVENILTLPAALIGFMIRSCYEAMQPGNSPGTSAATGAPAEQTDRSLPGTSSFGRPSA